MKLPKFFHYVKLYHLIFQLSSLIIFIICLILKILLQYMIHQYFLRFLYDGSSLKKIKYLYIIIIIFYFVNYNITLLIIWMTTLSSKQNLYYKCSKLMHSKQFLKFNK
jgi:hypothetical protein